MDAPVFHKPIEPFRVRALTIHQVWASLILWGVKRFETRHWSPYNMIKNELLLIHAGKKFGPEERANCQKEPFRSVLMQRGIANPQKQLAFGAALCIAKLLRVYKAEDVRDSLSPMERAFGNFGNKRFAWELEIVHVFEKPIPMAGEQGLFTVEFPRNPMLPKLEVLTGGKTPKKEPVRYDSSRYGMLPKWSAQRSEFEQSTPVMWKHRLLVHQIADAEKRMAEGNGSETLARMLLAYRERLREGEEAIKKGTMRQ